jgi:hypothetical protein
MMNRFQVVLAGSKATKHPASPRAVAPIASLRPQ